MNISEIGLFGIIYLGIISLSINFILPLTQIINTLVLIAIFVLLFFQKIFKIKELNKILLGCLNVSIIATIFLAYSKSYTPDAFLYHLPYTNLINDYKIIPGSYIVHFRFGHISILQYVNAFFNNLLIGINGITFVISLILSFFLVHIISELQIILKKNKKINFYDYFIILTFIFLCIRMNRYSDFGNDHPATIFFLYFMSIFIKNFNEFDFDTKKYLTIFSAFIFTLKIFYFVPIILCLYIWLSKISFKIFNSVNILSIFFLFFWLLKNILVSGCAIYPVNFTCIDKLPWHDKSSQHFTSPKNISLSSEAWAKNWNTKKDKDKNKENFDKLVSQKEFIKNFNWLNEWLNDHGKYILVKIAPFILAIIIIFLLTKNNNNFEKKINTSTYQFYFFILINICGFLLWFLKFPIMRYGLAYIFMLIFFISFYFLNNRNLNKIKYVLLICSLVFIFKNVVRISNNYDNNPYPEVLEELAHNFTEKKNFKIYLTKSDSNLCGYFKSPCTNYSQNLKKFEIQNFKGYIYFSLIK